ncbi:hypothetical protein CY652_11040 [Burkholderia sp. WAC0059]|nr:hypothetical protein CY652_11040 [Burkholderia sp. WAC0059]
MEWVGTGIGSPSRTTGKARKRPKTLPWLAVHDNRRASRDARAQQAIPGAESGESGETRAGT